MRGFKGLFSIAAFGALIVATGAVTSAQATTWDAVSQFSVTANPNPYGWSYGEGAGGSTPALFTQSTGLPGGVSSPIPLPNGSDVQYWQSSTPTSYVPIVGENYGSTTECCGTIPAIPPGVLWVHPGISDDVIVQWTAPAAGTYTFSTSFTLLDSNPSGIIGEVFNGKAPIYSGVLTSPGATPTSPGATETFSDTLYLSAGGTLQFVVNNDGNFDDDSTALTATISSTPLPSTWTMLIAGFVGLGFFAYRGTKKNAGALAAA
jgi:hypothetical protein